MAVNVYSGIQDLTGLPLLPGSNDAIAVAPGAFLYSNNGTVIIVGTSSQYVQIDVQGSVFTGSASAAIFSSADHTGITVEASGLVSSQYAAIYMDGTSDTVTNKGTLNGISDGVLMSGFADAVVNSGTITAQSYGIYANGFLASIDNSGEIYGATQGVVIGGSSANVSNSGRIEGGSGIFVSHLGSMTLTNTGVIQGTGIGVSLTDGTSSIANSGTISGSLFGIYFYDTDINSPPPVLAVQNSGQIVSAGQAIFTTALFNLQNDGLIDGTSSASGYGLVLGGTSAIINHGTIEGGYEGIYVTSPVTLILTNAGDVLSDTQVAIQATSALAVVVSNTGLISGVTAMQLSANADSVTNSGHIIGDVYLNGGDDRFDGTGGTVAGAVYGGAGNDLFILSDTATQIHEAVGGGADTVQASVDYTLAAGQEIETLVLTGTARLGSGNEFANSITGNDQDNKLSGLAGADTLSGGLGNDTMNGGTENDNLSGGDDNDRLVGDTGNDVLNGDNGDDVLLGQQNNDKLYGGVGDDTLNGGIGTDSLSGGDGDDVLIGGQNRDTLTGGNDADAFVFAKVSEIGTVAAATNDVITDFVRGTDKIDLAQIDANTGTSTNDGFSFIGAAAFSHVAGQLHYVVSGANILLEGDVNGDGLADFQLQINAITAITAGDIVL